MRRAVVKHLDKMMEKDEDIIVLLGDLGFGIFDHLRLKYPDRIINCGIAEQNMIGVAAGLAIGGKKPVVYSIAPFVTTRALEQIKLDLCHQDVNVTIIGTGAGFAYGNLGPTHHCLEDFAALTCLPNLQFLQPYDKHSAVECLSRALKNNGPSYIRLTADGVDLSFFISERREVEKDVLLLATGAIAQDCVDIARELKLEVRFPKDFSYLNDSEKRFSMSTFLESFDRIITVEESYLRGGFGSSIAEIITDFELDCRLTRIGCKSIFATYGGSSTDIKSLKFLDKEGIEFQIREALEKK